MTYSTILENYADSLSPDNFESFPYYTQNNHWETVESSGCDDWIAGFYTGILWMAASENDEYLDDAIRATESVQPIHQRNFNIGFRYQYSWVPAYETTQEQHYLETSMQAADRLETCFHPEIELLCHAQDEFPWSTASDQMMNLPLLFWSLEHKMDTEHRISIVSRVLNQSKRLFVKPCGKVRHRLIFDPKTGKVKTVESPQGIRGGCWSRGLAWTATGFFMAGLWFNRKDYLQVADQIINYHREHSYQLIPAYDYSVSRLRQPRLVDTSAASILASGLLMNGLLNGKKEHLELGERIVNRLKNRYLMEDSEPGLLDGSCYHYNEDRGVNAATIWGDYYFLEALHMAERKQLPDHLAWLGDARESRNSQRPTGT